MKLHVALALAAVSLLPLLVRAAEPAPRKFEIEGVERDALIYVPDSAKTSATPLVFAFHGHGGNMKQAAKAFHMHTLWPEAICIYMQGLNTPGRLTDPEGKKPGWQSKPGDQNDRDLKFFDAVLKSVHDDYKIDDKRIYSTGHSNGGGFTYLLWATRGDTFAAVAPSSAAAAQLLKDLKPKPVLHVAGKADPLVKFEWQKATIDHLLQLNGCSAEGKFDGQYVTEYPSPTGTPVVTFIHEGGHSPPQGTWEAIAKFLKSQAKP
jgi:polyhydroxybutyrate depolymerase